MYAEHKTPFDGSFEVRQIIGGKTKNILYANAARTLVGQEATPTDLNQPAQ